MSCLGVHVDLILGIPCEELVAAISMFGSDNSARSSNSLLWYAVQNACLPAYRRGQQCGSNRVVVVRTTADDVDQLERDPRCPEAVSCITYVPVDR